MKIERLLGIVMTLLEDQVVPASVLSDKYNVSVRTIQRDIDTLSVAGFPIYAEQGKYGGYRLMDHFIMDKVPVNVKEQQLMHQIVACLSDMFEQKQFKYLEGKLGFGMEDQAKLGQDLVHDSIIKIDFSSWIEIDSLKSRLQEIYDAIDCGRSLIIQYGNNAGHVSERTVDPYHLHFKENSWYLHGFCHTRKAFRMFRVNRIINCQTAGIYVKREVPKLKPFKETPVQLELIRLRFKDTAYGKVLDYFNVKNVVHKEGNLEVSTMYPIDDWLENTLVGFGDSLLDIEPERLKNRVIERIEASLNQLKTSWN